jgi:hypothetical protein
MQLMDARFELLISLIKVISLNRTYDNELHVTHLATFLWCQLNTINIVLRRQSSHSSVVRSKTGGKHLAMNQKI